MELRFRARFSRTLRKYGTCGCDRWTEVEADVAERLLKVLRARGHEELVAARDERGQRNQTEDSWPWPPAGPDVAGLMAVAVDRVCEADLGRELVCSVAERLLGQWHMPAVREALQCLIPEWLDPALDDKQRNPVRTDPGRWVPSCLRKAGAWTYRRSPRFALASRFGRTCSSSF